MRGEVLLHFERLPRVATKIERRARQEHGENFYRGNANIDPLVYVSLCLDGVRPGVEGMTAEIARMGRDPFHMPICGKYKQGKSLFMARLAQNISLTKSAWLLGKRYHVLWWRQGNALGSDPVFDVNRLSEYRRCCVARSKLSLRRKPLIVFFDDVLKSDTGEEDISRRQEVRTGLRKLMQVDISVVTSDADGVVLNEESGSPTELRLRHGDKERILSKLIQEGFVSRERSGDVIETHSKETRRHRRNLAGFLGMAIEVAGRERPEDKTSTRVFKACFNRLSPTARSALKTVTMCSFVDLFPSEETLRKTCGELSPTPDSELGFFLSKETLSRGLRVYHIASPTLFRWLLIEAYKLGHAHALAEGLGSLFLKIADGDSHDGEESVIMTIVLTRLVRGEHSSVLEVHGESLAKAVWEFAKPALEPYLDKLVGGDILASWAATLSGLGEGALAEGLLLRGAECVQIPDGPATFSNIRAPISLAMGLLGRAKSREAREVAIDLLGRIKVKLESEDAEIWEWSIRRVTHKLAEVLEECEQPERALEVMEGVPDCVPPDGLLWQKRGDILESLGRLSEANECLKRSLEDCGGVGPRGPMDCLWRLQHYADFLVKQPRFAKEIGEDPEMYLERAEALIDAYQLHGLEAVLSVRAKYRKSKGDVVGARDVYVQCLNYCRETYLLHPQSWTEYANLLARSGNELDGATQEEHLAQAEELCQEVVESDGTDEISRRVSYHILGGLIGGNNPYTSVGGRTRPSYSEAVKMLQKAFESPPGDRDDDSIKTFQDVITHKVLGDVCSSWSRQKGLAPERSSSLVREAGAHYSRSFSGIPRQDLDSTKVRAHVVRAILVYARFLWQTSEWNSAGEHYRAAIEKWEEFGMSLPWGYTVYEYYAGFLYETKRDAAMVEIILLLRRALEIVPGDEQVERAELSYKLGHSLHSEFILDFDMLRAEQIVGKIDEVIEAFSSVLQTSPGAEPAAIELAHLLFVKDRPILAEACTEKRVRRMTDVLWQAWNRCPTNGRALEGLLDVADRVIGPRFGDDHWISELCEEIEERISQDESASEALYSVCQRRMAGRDMGRLTEMLCK